MTFTLFDIVLTSLLIFGVNATTRKNKIFGFVEEIVSHQGENSFVLSNAISECPVCMSSFYGFICYMYLTGTQLSLSYSDKILLYIIVLTTCLEIRDSYIQNKKIPKNLIKIIELLSRAMYVTFLLGYTIKLGRLELVFFILATAGLNSIIETSFIANIGRKNITQHLENANEIELNKLRNK